MYSCNINIYITELYLTSMALNFYILQSLNYIQQPWLLISHLFRFSALLQMFVPMEHLVESPACQDTLEVESCYVNFPSK